MTFIDTLKQITSEDRRRDYGHPLYNFIRIAMLQTLRYQFVIDFTPVDVAWDMTLTKAAREFNTPKFDNVLDSAGYMTCVGSMVDILTEYGIDVTDDDAYTFLSSLTFEDMTYILRDENKDEHEALTVLFTQHQINKDGLL